jgi:hypothetical protein
MKEQRKIKGHAFSSQLQNLLNLYDIKKKEKKETPLISKQNKIHLRIYKSHLD